MADSSAARQNKPSSLRALNIVWFLDSAHLRFRLERDVVHCIIGLGSAEAQHIITRTGLSGRSRCSLDRTRRRRLCRTKINRAWEKSQWESIVLSVPWSRDAASSRPLRRCRCLASAPGGAWPRGRCTDSSSLTTCRSPIHSTSECARSCPRSCRSRTENSRCGYSRITSSAAIRICCPSCAAGNGDVRAVRHQCPLDLGQANRAIWNWICVSGLRPRLVGARWRARRLSPRHHLQTRYTCAR